MPAHNSKDQSDDSCQRRVNDSRQQYEIRGRVQFPLFLASFPLLISSVAPMPVGTAFEIVVVFSIVSGCAVSASRCGTRDNHQRATEAIR
jgi:hypothetical protein